MTLGEALAALLSGALGERCRATAPDLGNFDPVIAGRALFARYFEREETLTRSAMCREVEDKRRWSLETELPAPLEE
jgi:hypothetical protein